MLAGLLLVLPARIPTTVEIAPGVEMPYVNLGGVHSHPSNYSAWLELGGTGLDTALMYGDDVQLETGKAVEASGIPREQLFVTSKVPCCPSSFTSWCKWYDSEYDDLSAYTRAEIDARLLGLETVDLMLLHWPCDTVEDTVRTYRSLEKFQLDGKARAIGISNFNASAIDALFEHELRVKPVVNQCGFSIGGTTTEPAPRPPSRSLRSPLHRALPLTPPLRTGHNDTKYGRDFETLDKCRAKGITYSAYSPLGGLSGVDVLSNPQVVAVGKAHNKSSAQVALRWVTQQGVVAVTASTKPSHLAGDLDIFDFTLSSDEMATLTKI